jgi:hypothetical protein
MKAEVWELKLAYSPIDLLLGNYEVVKEIYVPSLKHAFNFYDSANVIKYNENRYKSSSYWFYENVKPTLIKNIKLNSDQIKLFKNLLKQNNLTRV